MRSGLGQKARKLAEDILEVDPENSYAHGLLAVWNMEVLRRGGRIGARVMGASSRKGLDHYARAAAAAPDDGALHWQWARVLAATNVRKYREHIDAALLACLSARTDNQLENALQMRAQGFKDEMARLDYKQIEALAISLL